jgi:hypothetical protein
MEALGWSHEKAGMSQGILYTERGTAVLIPAQ